MEKPKDRKPWLVAYDDCTVTMEGVEYYLKNSPHWEVEYQYIDSPTPVYYGRRGSITLTLVEKPQDPPPRKLPPFNTVDHDALGRHFSYVPRYERTPR